MMHSTTKKKFTEIEDIKENIFNWLRPIDPEILQKKPDENKWSAGQILGHLVLSERASVLYIRRKIKAGDDLPNAGVRSAWRMFLLKNVFNGKRKFKAPEPVANPKNLSLVEAEKEWEQVRNDLKEFIEDYPKKYESKAIFKHPIAGRIRLDQMLEFFKIHMIHHKRQLEKTLENNH